MSSTGFLVALVTACLVSVTVGDIAAGPQNIAGYINGSVILQCQSTTAGNERVYFLETTTGLTRQISDNGSLITTHPNYARYNLNTNHATGLHTLTISLLQAADAGVYGCTDANQVPSTNIKKNQIIVISGNINYTTTIPVTGITNRYTYYTAECRTTYYGVASPYFLFTGPQPFLQAYTNTTVQAWSGMSFTADKVHDGSTYTCRMNFTVDRFLTADPDMASNVPTLTATATTGVIFVQWPPTNISYSPVLQSYEIGTVLRCDADSMPTPRFTWHDMDRLVDYPSQTLTITAVMVGVTQLRCEAINAIASLNLFTNITVNPLTTTTTAGPTTPTTTVPAIAPCDSLNGRWEATRDDGSTILLCLYYQVSQGLMQGLMLNDTVKDLWWSDLAGVLETSDNSEFGLTTLYAAGGVGGFAGECRKCYGVEHMLVSGVSRNSNNMFFCNIHSDTIESPLLTFSRVLPVSPTCPATSQAWEHHIAKRRAERRRRRSVDMRR